MKRIVYKIDEEGFILWDTGLVINEDEEIPEGYYLQPIYNEGQPSFYKPRWDGEKWVEGMSQEEINQLLNKPVEPTENDILRDYILELEYRLILLELEL